MARAVVNVDDDPLKVSSCWFYRSLLCRSRCCKETIVPVPVQPPIRPIFTPLLVLAQNQKSKMKTQEAFPSASRGISFLVNSPVAPAKHESHYE